MIINSEPNEAQPGSAPIPTRAAQPARARAAQKRRSPWLLRSAVLFVVVLVGVLLALGAKKRPIAVDTATVERGTVKDEISSSTAGEVMAERKATVRAELSARVLAVKHQRGERVKAEEPVAMLDTADLDARLRQSQATLEAQRAQVAQAEAHAEAGRRTADIAKRLAERGVQAPQSAEDAATQAREADAAARAARASVAQSVAALQVAKVARSHGALTAPFDGLLSEVFVDPGEQAQAGAPVFEIVDDARLHVEATVDEADIARVKVGQPAALRLDALPEHPIAGVVSRLDPTVRTDAKGARTLRLEVEVSDLPRAREAGVRPGMSANVDVVVADKQNVLQLPTNVIIGRGTKRSVFVIENGVAVERPIQIGISSWERTEILSGLREGDRVVATLNAKGLADGVRVEASEGAR
ncbi:MAG TPA: efflux RND transporter periplasmic adaptor subunit [Polyangiaceae bacterium]|nr:efflux RND transporter periplasmic adaptor subunit [Polyangiaceae bacterium]